MKIVIRTLLFHLTCIVAFTLFYYGISSHFHEKMGRNTEWMDFVLLGATIQAGVGFSELVPVSFLSKAAVTIQQLIMLSTHIITLYIFTL